MFSTGQTIAGRYRILREIGQGGYGRVHLAEELERGPQLSSRELTLPLDLGGDRVLRQVALKTFGRRPRLRQDLRAELRALCRLSHPSIVGVYDYSLDDPAYIAMEYVSGRDLQSWLEDQGALPLADALAIARQIGAALAHAHAVGVLHRDVKPSNVIVSESMRAKLVDFGLARGFERLAEQSTKVGTPGFVAPELLDPDRFRAPIGVAADVYGLGCLLHALLVGRSPFVSDTPVRTLRQQLSGEWADRSELAAPLQAALERATALEPAQRFPSIPAFLEVLERLALALEGSAAPPRDGPRLDLVDAQVQRLELFDHPRRGPGLKFELIAAGEPSARRGFVYRGGPDSSTRPMFEDLEGAWPGCELSLYGAGELASDGKGTFLTGDDQTLPVLEPHFLVPVTDVVRSQGARARDCAARPFVDLREGIEASRPLLIGRLLHTALDRLVETGAAEAREAGAFESAFDEIFAQSRIDAVAAGLGDADLEGLREECRPSWEWLSRFVARHVEGAGHSAEVTRFSGRYGLEGRIDLALLGEERLEIVELKSGRHQNPEHDAQLRCYTLLWDHAAESLGRCVRGRLLYCRNGLEKPVSRQDHARERRIVRSRNQLVAAHHALARGELESALPHHGQWPERCEDAPCRFRARRCATQCANVGHGEWSDARAASVGDGPWAGVPVELVVAARAYYRHFVRLVEIEYVAQSREQGAFTRPRGLDRRVEQRDALRGAVLAEWDAGLRAVRFRHAEARRLVPGRDLVAHRGEPDLGPMLVGRVERVEGEDVVIRCEGAAMCGALPDSGWVLEPLALRIGRREAHRALYALTTERDPGRLASLLGMDEAFSASLRSVEGGPGGGPPDPPRLTDAYLETLVPRLNGPQAAAVRLALEEPSRPVLVHGPPGTGKTTLIAALVRALVESGQRVVVAAGTNTAVDNVLEQLLRAGVDFLRLGALEPNSPLARRHGRDVLTRRVERWLGAATPSLDGLAERLRTVPVVAGTAHRCIRSPSIEALRLFAEPRDVDGPAIPFDVAIVDEASQLTEPLALGVVMLARRFVLVGDARQLPPVLASDEARTPYVEPGLTDVQRRLGLGGLDRTLFERLAGRVPEAALELQYRMSAEVQDLASRLYYGGRLAPAPSAARRRLALADEALGRLPEPVQARLDPARPIVWETLAGGVTGKHNPAEVAAVAETLAGLAQLWPADRLRDVGVISPFRAQCHALRVALAAALGPEDALRVEVDTVERFQGREKEIMLVSLVVSTWSDFVMDDRRLNVAFTRARSKLIVFGPAQLLYRFEAMLATQGD